MQEETRKQSNTWSTLAGKTGIAVLISTILFALLAVCWDFYLDLNDDMMIEHLLSGGYTGTPEMRDIQNLFPFSLLVSTLYRVLAVNWFGLILLGLLFLCLVLTLVRTMKMADRREETKARRILKVGGVLLVLLFYAAILLYHLVYVQYTVVVGVMGGTAAFLILTSDDAETARLFWKNNLPSFLLVTAGYLVRSEMMLFMLPFVGLAALFRVTMLCSPGEHGRKFDLKRWFVSLFGALGIVLALVGVCYALDAAAYAPADWKEFRNLFNARTDLYDFEAVPSYEENKAFYDSIGLNASEVGLLENYNFALDEKMDAKTMRQVVDAAALVRNAKKAPADRLKEALWVYLHQRLSGSTEMPWNMVSFVLYGLVCISALFTVLSAFLDRSGRKEAVRAALLQVVAVALLFAARSCLWLYLLYNGRPVERLTHSMYYAEGLILLTLLFYGRKIDITLPLKAAFAAMVFVTAISMQAGRITTEAQDRAVANGPYTSYKAYCNAHPEDFFLTDVYSTVDFSEKIFAANQPARNWDLAGGWAAKSPAQRRKLAQYGIEHVADDLRTQNHVFFAARSDYEIGWLGTFYSTLGEDVVITQVDTVDDYWTIYSVDAWTDVLADPNP